MKPCVQRRRRRRALRLAPLAYLKLQYLCHAGPTEVGAFGVSAEQDLLYLEDVVTLRQDCSVVTTRFHDEAVADHLDRCADAGVPPQRCGRVWLHTHPGNSALPSGTDEETFARAFGPCDWAVMAILSRGGTSYGRLRVSGGPGATRRLRWAVDWSAWPQELTRQDLARLVEEWAAEYAQTVRPEPRLTEIFPGQTAWPQSASAVGTPGVEPFAGFGYPGVQAELDDWYYGAFWEPADAPLFDPYPAYGGEHVHELP